MHLKANPPFSEPSEDFGTVKLGSSAKAALDRAEIVAANQGQVRTGTNALMLALLKESDGPVHLLLTAAKSTTDAADNTQSNRSAESKSGSKI